MNDGWLNEDEHMNLVVAASKKFTDSVVADQVLHAYELDANYDAGFEAGAEAHKNGLAYA